MKIKTFEYNPFGENTFIVFDEPTGEAAVIDPGMMKPWEYEAFDQYIKDQRLKIKYLINTHIHVDHAAADDYVARHYGVGLSASALDGFLAERVAEQARMFHLEIDVSSLSIAHELNDGDRLKLGHEELEVISVPGHSPGSIAIYCAASRFVIVGDALFKGSIGRTDLPGGNYAQLIKSITTRLLSLPDDTTVFPGHGPATTILDERRFNPFL